MKKSYLAAIIISACMALQTGLPVYASSLELSSDQQSEEDIVFFYDEIDSFDDEYYYSDEDEYYDDDEYYDYSDDDDYYEEDGEDEYYDYYYEYETDSYSGSQLRSSYTNSGNSYSGVSQVVSIPETEDETSADYEMSTVYSIEEDFQDETESSDYSYSIASVTSLGVSSETEIDEASVVQKDVAVSETASEGDTDQSSLTSSELSTENSQTSSVGKITMIAHSSCGAHAEWALQTNGILIISGSGDMYDYHSWDVPWSQYKSYIHSVIIDYGITSIGNYAFSSDYHMSNVTIPVTVKKIGKNAFEGCNLLQSVKLHKGLEKIGDDAFKGCSRITSVIIPNSVKSIGDEAFAQCKNLRAVTILGNNTRIGLDSFKTDLNVNRDADKKLLSQARQMCFGSVAGTSAARAGSYSLDLDQAENTTQTSCPVIYGLDGSTAEKYAVANGLTFKNPPIIVQLLGKD